MNPLGALQQALGMVKQGAGDFVHGVISNFPVQLNYNQPKAPVPTPAPVATRRQGNDQELNTLIQNTIDQTPYTPAARQHIEKMMYDYYGNDPQDNQTNNMTGGMFQGPNHVMINSAVMDPNQDGGGGVSTLRHELIHSMDRQASGGNSKLFDSAHFLVFLQKFNPQLAKLILNNSLSSPIYDQKNQASQNMEAAAYYAQSPGHQMSDNPALTKIFSQIYQPRTPLQRYSPVYMSPENAGALWDIQNPGGEE